MERIFVVRIKPGGQDRVPEALETSQLIVGWEDAPAILDPDLDWVGMRDAVAAIYHPAEKRNNKAAAATMSLWNFLREIRVGDIVLVPHRSKQFYVAQVTGEPTHDNTTSTPGFKRSVRWLNQGAAIQRQDAPDVFDALLERRTCYDVPFARRPSIKPFVAKMLQMPRTTETRVVPGMAGDVGRPAAGRGRAKPPLAPVVSKGSPELSESVDFRKLVPTIRTWLVRIACNRSTVTYGQVMETFGFGRFNLRRAMDILGHQARQLGEPIITALIIGKHTGVCSRGLRTEFGVEDDALERIKLYEFWEAADVHAYEPDPGIDDGDINVRTAIFASMACRPEQALFRKRVFKHWGGRCVISGCEVARALDAAHRHGRDWRLGHNRAGDGFLLRKDLHALYDAKLLHISEAGAIQIDPRIAGHYNAFAGMSVVYAERKPTRAMKDRVEIGKKRASRQ